MNDSASSALFGSRGKRSSVSPPGRRASRLPTESDLSARRISTSRSPSSVPRRETGSTMWSRHSAAAARGSAVGRAHGRRLPRDPERRDGRPRRRGGPGDDSRSAISANGWRRSGCTGASSGRGSLTSPSFGSVGGLGLRPQAPDLGRFVPSEATVYHVPSATDGGAVCGHRIGCTRRLTTLDREQVTRRRTEPDRPPVRQGLGHEDERPSARRHPVGLDGVAVPRRRTRRRRAAARSHRRDLRARVLGQDDARLPRHRGGPAAWRHLRLHRRRACDGSRVRQADRRQHRRPPRLAAGPRRAGARDRRAPDPLGRARRRRHRLRGSADADAPRSRARWGTATWASRRGS